MFENLDLLYNEESCFFVWLGDIFLVLISLYVVGNNMMKVLDFVLKLW